MARDVRERSHEGRIQIFTRFITVKGRKIPPPNGQKVWCIWVKQAADLATVANPDAFKRAYF